MLSLEELRAMPGAKRLQRAALITVMIWLAALLAFSAALSAMSENEDRLGDAEKILNAAITVNEELGKLVEDIQRNGLSVKTAELRSLTGQKDGRLINVTLTIVGEDQ